MLTKFLLQNGVHHRCDAVAIISDGLLSMSLHRVLTCDTGRIPDVLLPTVYHTKCPISTSNHYRRTL